MNSLEQTCQEVNFQPIDIPNFSQFYPTGGQPYDPYPPYPHPPTITLFPTTIQWSLDQYNYLAAKIMQGMLANANWDHLDNPETQARLVKIVHELTTKLINQQFAGNYDSPTTEPKS